MCDQIWADYHVTMNDEFTQPIEEMVNEGECEMKKYQIENTESGVVMGVYEAETKEEALDKLAQDAGYQDAADATAQVGAAPLKVVEVG